GAPFGSLLQLGVDRCSERLRIVEPPEVETADAVRLEELCQRDAAFEQLVLRVGIEVGVKLVAFLTQGRSRRSGPVCLEERTGNVGDGELVCLKNLPGIL